MTKELLLQGDCLTRLKELEDNSVDSCVTDPPYGLSKEPDINEVLTKWLAGEEYDHRHGGFMGKAWDSFVPHPDIWREVYRVLKPGGHALVFAGTRTQDLMTVSLRLAGFEVRDVIEWLYFSGFPKSHDVGKAFDKRAGELGVQSTGFNTAGGKESYAKQDKSFRSDYGYVYEPKSELARKWDGWGTALKPAHEPIIMVRKPLHDGKKMTVVDCVEKYGTGAINIDASRIATDDSLGGGLTSGSVLKIDGFDRPWMHDKDVIEAKKKEAHDKIAKAEALGRFPANCITLDSEAFYSKYFNVSAVSNISPAELSKKASKKDRNSDWRGEEIGLIPKEVDSSHFYGMLPDLRMESKQKRLPNANNHPTVKPTDLMAWLVRLVTQPGGIVLDPFAGSGSTLVAAKREGFGFIGVEREKEYIEICGARTGLEAIE